jgi:glycosyltransferase involved in cell wall biosynthesis
MKKGLKIWIITSSFPLNPRDSSAAAGLFVRDFALALSELGHRVTVVTPDKERGEKEEPPGLSVCWFPWKGRSAALAYLKPYKPNDAIAMLSLFWQAGRTLNELMASERPDHVTAMWAVPAGYFARRIKKRYGVPYTTWCLGSDIWTYGRYPLLKHVVKAVLRDSDLIYADGLRLAEDVSRLAGRECPFLPSSRRLDRGRIQPAADRSQGTRFLFVGRYAPVKGVDILFEAMARFLRGGHRGHLHVFGGGPLEHEVRGRAARIDLRGHVTVGGYADEATYVASLAACDCFVIPSRMESIPVVLSDALQMGKPLIVTDVGDMGRLLREHPAGLVVPAEDPGALSEAMVKMATEDRARYTPHVTSLAEQFDLAHVARRWAEEVASLRPQSASPVISH